LKKVHKISLIIILAITGFLFTLVLIVCTPYIMGKVRVWRLTRDMTGGTCLVYEIDTIGISEEQKKNLSNKMIPVLRQRIDPDRCLPIFIQSLDDTHFEIRIPPALTFPTANDIQRMLKGAGVLEFRILPTEEHPDVDIATMNGYIERLKEKGPEQASDEEYIWCEIENYDQWRSVDAQKHQTIIAQFEEKHFVLASNKLNEVILITPGKDAWTLKKAYPTYDETGRCSIGFIMDDTGGKLMQDVTGNNIGRPLCILLDGIALSAPCIEGRIPGRGRITGSFTNTEVEDIINKLNAGCLPARLIEKPIEVKTIGANIGS
jgi:preprotein translocase subunit SecD